jgi:hypothetical protein
MLRGYSEHDGEDTSAKPNRCEKGANDSNIAWRFVTRQHYSRCLTFALSGQGEQREPWSGAA